jgi:signal transduction histidine kinase/ActR/RegA family two-component response regulator
MDKNQPHGVAKRIELHDRAEPSPIPRPFKKLKSCGAILLAFLAFVATVPQAFAGSFGLALPHGGTVIIIGVAGTLQLCVAVYALRLNRLFGTGRVGWSLFWAFLLLGLLHLVQSTSERHAITQFQVDLEVVYMIIGLLLLIGMAHLHAVLRHKQEAEQQRKLLESRMRQELELQVREKTDYLKRAVENLPASEAMGRPYGELFAEDILRCDAAVKNVLEKRHWEGEMTNRTKAGQKVLADEDWTLVLDTDDKPSSIMIVSADITEKRKFESQTLRLQRLESIGTLASGIAHDLNNVLTPLLISVQLLKEKVTSKEQNLLLDTLNRNAVRGARLVKQILTFGRGVKGDRVVVKPGNVVQEIKQLVLDTFPKSLKLQVNAPADLWTVIGDATQLHQVLLNLCVNARDAMPRGGTLTIQLENVVLDEASAARNLEAKAGPYVRLQVADTGSGIPKSIQSRIFEPFFTTKEQGQGTGLGLSTCFTIVKNHGGFITCYSEPGKGSAFKVYLPANTSVHIAEQPVTSTVTLPSGRGELVLIVDDEQVIREFAQVTLQCYGYRTLTAANGAEAVSLYKSRPTEIAVVLLDMWMPIMDGPATIEALKGMDPHVLIIGTSGLGAAAMEKMESHVTCFIPKPYTTETLLNVLKDVLEHAITSPSALPAPVPAINLVPA